MAKNRTAISSVYVLVGMLCAIAGRIVAFAVLSRILTKALYGQFQQLWLIGTLVAGISSLGLIHSMQYFIPQLSDKQSRRRFFVRTLFLLEFAALVGGVAIYLFAEPLGRLLTGGTQLAPILRRCWPLMLFLVFGAQCTRIFTSIESPKLAGAAAGAYGAAIVLSLCGTVLFSHSIEHLAWVYATVTGAVFLITGVLGWARIRDLPEKHVSSHAPLRSGLMDQMQYALPLAGTVLVATASRLLSKALVSNRFSAAEYAVFANGAVELPIGVLVTGAVAVVLQARLTRAYDAHDLGRVVSVVRLTAANTCLLVYPIAVFAAVFGRDSMLVLFGPKYAASGWIFTMFSLGMLVRTYEPYSIVNATGKTWITLMMDVLWLGCNFVGCWIGIELYGMFGAAAGTVLGLIVVQLIYSYVAARAVGVPLYEFLPWKQMGRTLGASLLAGAAAGALLAVPISSLLRLLMGAVIGGCVYYVAGRKLGAIRSEHLELLREFITRRRHSDSKQPR